MSFVESVLERAKAQRGIGYGVIGLIMVLGGAIWLYPSNQQVSQKAMEEFTLAQRAVFAAKSWHSHIYNLKDGSVASDLASDVVCPLDKRDVSDTTGYERVTLDGVGYSKDASGQWQHTIYDPFHVNKLTDCTQGPLFIMNDPLSSIDRMRAYHVLVKKGELKTVDGESCRQWVIPREGIYPYVIVCINPEDHLPREVLQYSPDRTPVLTGRLTLTRWNQVTVTPPI